MMQSMLYDHIQYYISNITDETGRKLRPVLYRIGNLLSGRPKLVLYCGICLTILAACIAILVFPGSSVNASPDHVEQKYFTTIQVQNGDTLWQIAEDHMSTQYTSIQDYMEEIESINHISGDKITAGCYLVIPYYAEEPITN